MVLKVRIIPTILLKNGMAVKSRNFTAYRPVGSYMNAVRVYNTRNVDELVFLDIDATRMNRPIQPYVSLEIAEECRMPLTVGGGISSISQMQDLFKASSDKISINSAALSNPDLISNGAEQFGSANLVISIDVRHTPDGYRVFSNGGTKNTGLDPIRWAGRVCDLGAGEILLTSIDHDGVMNGFDIKLIKTIVENTSIPVIASGGAGIPQHFVDAILGSGVHALSAASMFHFTQFTPMDVKHVLDANGIPVRL